jgi:hypothetical protein
MENVKTQLADALRQRLAIIRDDVSRQDPQAHIARLQAASERITALEARLPKPVHPQLAHFLSRCSYSKALEFLEHK